MTEPGLIIHAEDRISVSFRDFASMRRRRRPEWNAARRLAVDEPTEGVSLGRSRTETNPNRGPK